MINLFNFFSNPPTPEYDDPCASEYGEYRYNGRDYFIGGAWSI